METLSNEDKREAMRAIQKGEPLDERFRFLLFGEKRQVELVYNGKTREVCRAVLPFQVVEQVDEPRAKSEQESKGTHDDLFSVDARGRQQKGWTNKLIWGDNRLILSSLKGREWRQRIRDEGGLKLVYIDPPFNSDRNYNIGGEALLGENGGKVEKVPSLLEEIAYKDTWGKGRDSFLAMLYERLRLIHDLLASDGSVYVHCDHHMSSYIKVVMDEIFSNSNFRNEIIWYYKNASRGKKQFAHSHDTIFWYSKNCQDPSTVSWIFNREDILQPFASGMTEWRYKTGGQKGKEMPKGKTPDDVITIAALNAMDSVERTGYPTQKPKKLLQQIIKASSNEGDLVADFFCGSGTLAEVAEELGRKWIAADMGRFAIHTTRKRLLTTQQRLKEDKKPYRAFEILNIGKYERARYLSVNKNLSEQQQQQQRQQKYKEYITMILKAYRAKVLEPLSPPFHGKKRGRLVVVGSLTNPVTRDDLHRVTAAAQARKEEGIDMLAFTFAHGLSAHLYTLKQEQKKSSDPVDIRLKKIPQEVFQKSLVEEGKEEIKFYDLAYIAIEAHLRKKDKGNSQGKDKISGYEVSVEITNFANYYDAKTREAAEKYVKNWYDWIDYWSVDFDWESKRELIRHYKDDKTEDYEERWTGDYIFENEWQDFRTRGKPSVELQSAWRPVPPSCKSFKVAVQAIDIFGNDSMTVQEVSVPKK